MENFFLFFKFFSYCMGVLIIILLYQVFVFLFKNLKNLFFWLSLRFSNYSLYVLSLLLLRFLKIGVSYPLRFYGLLGSFNNFHLKIIFLIFLEAEKIFRFSFLFSFWSLNFEIKIFFDSLCSENWFGSLNVFFDYLFLYVIFQWEYFDNLLLFRKCV